MLRIEALSGFRQDGYYFTQERILSLRGRNVIHQRIMEAFLRWVPKDL